MAKLGVTLNRLLYHQTPRERKHFYPAAVEERFLTSSACLGEVATFAISQVAQELYPDGKWIFRWVARETIAVHGTPPLYACACCLQHCRDCFQVADGCVQDDFLSAAARIDACLCLMNGGGGVIEKRVNGKRCAVFRDFMKRKGKDSFVRVQAIEAVNTAKLVQMEEKRAASGMPPFQLDPGDNLLVDLLEIRRLWNEAMTFYDKLESWKHGFLVYRESWGWEKVAKFLEAHRSATGKYVVLTGRTEDLPGFYDGSTGGEFKQRGGLIHIPASTLRCLNMQEALEEERLYDGRPSSSASKARVDNLDRVDTEPAEELIGKTVEIIGLQGRPELNGREGTPISFDAAKGRYKVKLAHNGEMLAVKPANLRSSNGTQAASGAASSSSGSSAESVKELERRADAAYVANDNQKA